MDAEKVDYEKIAQEFLWETGDMPDVDEIVAVLRTAHEAGRRDGIEEAAQCVEIAPLALVTADHIRRRTNLANTIRALVRPK